MPVSEVFTRPAYVTRTARQGRAGVGRQVPSPTLKIIGRFGHTDRVVSRS